MNPSVVVHGLAKNYGGVAALTELSFAVNPGSIYGLIGANGAGKTTSLAILAGLLRPTAGSATIMGMEVRPNRRELVSKIGFASPQYSFFDYLTGAELLLAFGVLHGLGKKNTKSRAADLLELFELEAAAGQYLYQYSQGMRQKLGLACALIHAPDVLLLDEPFTGLDSTSVYRLVCLLRRTAGSGRCVVRSGGTSMRSGGNTARREVEARDRTSLCGWKRKSGEARFRAGSADVGGCGNAGSKGTVLDINSNA